MNILGIGGMELALILLITLFVAGPKRLLSWSHQLGRFLARAQRLWADSASLLQRELDEAGMDIRVPRQIPTRRGLTQQLRGAMRQAVRPLGEPIEEIQDELRADLRALSQDAAPKEGGNPSAGTADASDYGSWSEEK